jgi:hypothetical protein
MAKLRHLAISTEDPEQTAAVGAKPIELTT